MSLKRTEMSDLWSRSRGPGTEDIFRDFSCWSRLGSGPGLKATVYRTICHTATNVLLSWFMDMFLFFRLPVFIVKSFIPGVLINGGIIALKRTRRKFIPFLDKCHCLRPLLLTQGCQALLRRRLSILESRTPTIARSWMLRIKCVLVYGQLSRVLLSSYFKLPLFSLSALLL